MIIPPLLIGSALLFWGFQSEKAVIGIMLCLVMEGSFLEKRRYRLDEADFATISDLTSLLFLGTVALVILYYGTFSFLRITAGWLPFILSPLMAAQLYSTSDAITIGTRLGRKNKGYVREPVDFRIYYLAVCLFAAATGNSRSFWFYVILAAIVAVLLFVNRGRSFSFPFFAALLALSLGLGLFAGVAMEKGHGYVMHNTLRFLYKYYREQHSNPYKTHVNFGDTGRQKASGEIIMRVDSESIPPYLFREAVYDVFQNGDWFGSQAGYELLIPDREQWHLPGKPETPGESLTVELGLPRERGLISAPAGAYRLSSDTIFKLERHENGSLRIADGARVAVYGVDHHPSVMQTDVPEPKNLVVPEEERYALEQVKEQLAHEGLSPKAGIKAAREFFADGFSYSLNLLGKGEQDTPLGNFLLRQKRGFCEYYATATALLLRSLGVPSRYAVGYAVSEKSILEGKYIVRGRHAHAWAEAYVGGRWIAVDTTPAQWFAEDAEQASAFEGIRDIFSFLLHKYRLYQTGSGRDYTLPLSIAVVFLTVLLILRIYRRLEFDRAEPACPRGQPRTFPRIITPFTPVIDRLPASGIERLEHESLTSWAARSRLWPAFDKEEFQFLYNLHLELRFDPAGHSAEIERTLRAGSEKYLNSMQETASNSSSLGVAGKTPGVIDNLPHRIFMKISTAVKKL